MDREERRKMERSGNIHHMNDIRWCEVDVGEVGSIFSNTLDFLIKHSAIGRTSDVHTMECSWTSSSYTHLMLIWHHSCDECSQTLSISCHVLFFCVVERRLKLKLQLHPIVVVASSNWTCFTVTATWHYKGLIQTGSFKNSVVIHDPLIPVTTVLTGMCTYTSLTENRRLLSWQRQ